MEKLDYGLLKEDVVKMRDAGVPDADIDQHISEKGWTPDEFLSFKEQPKAESEIGLGQALISGVANAPEDILNIGKGLVQSALHPITVGKNIMDLATGTAQRINRALPGYKENLGTSDPEIKRKMDLSRSATKDIGTSFGTQGYKAWKEKVSERLPSVGMDVGSAVAPGLKAVGLGKAAEIVDIATNPIRAGGEVLGAIAKKAFSPFAKAFMPDIMKLAEKNEIELPASSMTTNRAVQLIEAKAGKSISGQDLVSMIEESNRKLKVIADDVVANAGKEQDILKMGATIDDGLKNFKKEFLETKSDMYKAGELKNVTNPTIMTNAIEAIDEILGSKGISLTKDTGLIRELKALKKALSTKKGATMEGVPLNAAESTFHDIKDKINWAQGPAKTGSNAIYAKISGAMSEDIDSTLKVVRPDLKDAIVKANKYYKDNINLLNSKWGKAIYANSGKPDLIMKSLLNKDMSTVDIPSFMNAIGDEASQAIRVATLKDLFSGGLNVSKKLENEFYSTKLKSILTQEQYKIVEDVGALKGALMKGDKIMGGSQTAFLRPGHVLELLSAIGGTAAGGVTAGAVAATVAIIGTAGWNKFISSPIGRQWLTRGYSIPGYAGTFKNILSKTAVATKQPEVSEEQPDNTVQNAIQSTKE